MYGIGNLRGRTMMQSPYGYLCRKYRVACVTIVPVLAQLTRVPSHASIGAESGGSGQHPVPRTREKYSS